VPDARSSSLLLQRSFSACRRACQRRRAYTLDAFVYAELRARGAEGVRKSASSGFQQGRKSDVWRLLRAPVIFGAVFLWDAGALGSIGTRAERLLEVTRQSTDPVRE